MAYRETAQVSQRKAELRERLLQSAESLVREGGFRALTIQALARDAGVSVGSVYRYFKNKDQLATEVFSHATRREVGAVKTALSGGGSQAQRLRSGVTVFSERAFRAPQFAWALIAEPVDPAVDEARLHFRREYTGLFEAVIQQGIDSGEFVSQRASLTAAALVGALAESLLGPLVETEYNVATIEELCRLCLRAVGINEEDRV